MIEAVLLLLCVLGCVVLVAAPLPSSEMIDPRSPRARTVRGTEKRMAYTLRHACLIDVVKRGRDGYAYRRTD